MAPKKILITGVSGLIGSSVYLHMLSQPARYEVYGLGRRRALSERVPEGRQVDLPSARFFLCDVADMVGVQAAVKGIGWGLAEDRPRQGAADVWCSQRDIVHLIECCSHAPEALRFGIYYGISDNQGRWVDLKNARRDVGYQPQDRAEDFLTEEGS